MTTTVLVANRGEIAVRVIRACRRLGVRAVLAASAADTESLAAELADETLCIGPAPPAASYLRVDLVVQAALSAGADVLHPGYGFLSEQPALIRACDDQGIAFAGPRADTVAAAGDKQRARRAAEDAGVPVAGGGAVANADEAVSLADDLGYPVLVKAVHGGGGRGITPARDSAELRKVIPRSAAEAAGAFGDGSLYLERYLADARHVEVQVFGDGEGGVVVLGERDCSVQRRHQKLIEESPAPGLSAEVRATLHDSAAALAASLGYRGAGTVEFLVERGTSVVVFLEINARIQVEHPVTEERFGVDIVAAQLRQAVGDPHGLPTDLGEPPGHVLECRINAEDPSAGFRPTPGTLTEVRWPSGPGVRVDTHLRSGDVFPPNYDSLMGKVIVRAHDRDAALDTMDTALATMRLEGVPTTVSVHRQILATDDFRRGGVGTRWLEDEAEVGS